MVLSQVEVDVCVHAFCSSQASSVHRAGPTVQRHLLESILGLPGRLHVDLLRPILAGHARQLPRPLSRSGHLSERQRIGNGCGVDCRRRSKGPAARERERLARWALCLTRARGAAL